MIKICAYYHTIKVLLIFKDIIIMGGIKFLYILIVFLLNFGLWKAFSILRKRKTTGLKKQAFKSGSILIQVISILISLGVVLRFFEIRVEDLLNIELLKIGKNISITGYLLLFVIFSFSFFTFTNRLLTKFLKESKENIKIPDNVISGLRQWITFVAFVVIISGILKFTHHSFSFFSIVLFSVQDVQITIGKISQAFFIAFTVYVSIITIEYFYNERIKNKGIDLGKGHTVFQIVKYFTWVITISIILSSIGLNLNLLLAGSAALFVGLGFGVQTLFNDFVSGLIILFEGTIRVNDIVELENGIIGKVHEIGLRTSRLLTRDNIINIIPNNNFVGKNVINWSYNEHKTRFNVKVGVAYGSNVKLVEKILIECADENEKIHKNPRPFVYFNDFGESSLDFSLYFWIDDSFWVEKVRSDLRFAINAKFIENQIEIPFPQRDLHIRSGYKQEGIEK